MTNDTPLFDAEGFVTLNGVRVQIAPNGDVTAYTNRGAEYWPALKSEEPAGADPLITFNSLVQHGVKVSVTPNGFVQAFGAKTIRLKGVFDPNAAPVTQKTYRHSSLKGRAIPGFVERHYP